LKLKGPLPVVVTAEDEAFRTILFPEAKFFTTLFKYVMPFVAFVVALASSLVGVVISFELQQHRSILIYHTTKKIFNLLKHVSRININCHVHGPEDRPL
jgi:hypothetical protein